MKVTCKKPSISGEQSQSRYIDGEKSSHPIGISGKNKPYDYIKGEYIKENNFEIKGNKNERLVAHVKLAIKMLEENSPYAIETLKEIIEQDWSDVDETQS